MHVVEVEVVDVEVSVDGVAAGVDEDSVLEAAVDVVLGEDVLDSGVWFLVHLVVDGFEPPQLLSQSMFQ